MCINTYFSGCARILPLIIGSHNGRVFLCIDELIGKEKRHARLPRRMIVGVCPPATERRCLAKTLLLSTAAHKKLSYVRYTPRHFHYMF